MSDPLKDILVKGRRLGVQVLRRRSRVHGYLDSVGTRHAAGWAAGRDGGPVHLVASVNGLAVARFETSLFRPDLVGFPRRDLGFLVDLGRSLALGDIVSVTDLRGEHLKGSPHHVRRIEPRREEKALWLVSRDMKILEIGPAYNPIAPRSKGWKSVSLDHATQEELRAKYRGQAEREQIEQIEPVDYVWKRGPIEAAIPKAEHGSFDAIIASHVIEHIPDPLAFFLSAAVLLNNRGLVSLVIPDKRMIFDFFKPLTLTSDYLYAHHLHRTRHSKKTAFDNVAYNVTENGNITWSIRPLGSFSFISDHSLSQARQIFDDIIEDEAAPYVDFHATVYTPSSFALIIFELGLLDVIPFYIEYEFPTAGCEFFVTLRKGVLPQMSPKEMDQERLRLIKNTVRDLGQQARWLADDEPESS
jgi:hypothetical protein